MVNSRVCPSHYQLINLTSLNSKPPKLDVEGYIYESICTILILKIYLMFILTSSVDNDGKKVFLFLQKYTLLRLYQRRADMIINSFITYMKYS